MTNQADDVFETAEVGLTRLGVEAELAKAEALGFNGTLVMHELLVSSLRKKLGTGATIESRTASV